MTATMIHFFFCRRLDFETNYRFNHTNQMIFTCKCSKVYEEFKDIPKHQEYCETLSQYLSNNKIKHILIVLECFTQLHGMHFTHNDESAMKIFKTFENDGYIFSIPKGEKIFPDCQGKGCCGLGSLVDAVMSPLRNYNTNFHVYMWAFNNIVKMVQDVEEWKQSTWMHDLVTFKKSLAYTSSDKPKEEQLDKPKEEQLDKPKEEQSDKPKKEQSMWMHDFCTFKHQTSYICNAVIEKNPDAGRYVELSAPLEHSNKRRRLVLIYS